MSIELVDYPRDPQQEDCQISPTLDYKRFRGCRLVTSTTSVLSSISWTMVYGQFVETFWVSTPLFGVSMRKYLHIQRNYLPSLEFLGLRIEPCRWGREAGLIDG